MNNFKQMIAQLKSISEELKKDMDSARDFDSELANDLEIASESSKHAADALSHAERHIDEVRKKAAKLASFCEGPEKSKTTFGGWLYLMPVAGERFDTSKSFCKQLEMCAAIWNIKFRPNEPIVQVLFVNDEKNLTEDRGCWQNHGVGARLARALGRNPDEVNTYAPNFLPLHMVKRAVLDGGLEWDVNPETRIHLQICKKQGRDGYQTLEQALNDVVRASNF